MLVGVVIRAVNFVARFVSWGGVDLEEDRLDSSQVSVQGLANGQLPWHRETHVNVCVFVLSYRYMHDRTTVSLL